MADWKCSREVIEVFEHPTAERLDICKAGGYQLICQKGLRKNGDIIIVIPHHSQLPDNPLYDGYRPYLAGPNKNIVRAQKMRQELSEGIVIDDQPELADVPIGEDISDKLGVTKYEVPVPAQLAGKVRPVGNIDTKGAAITRHDCVQFSVSTREFVEGEEVVVTEKLHGSQIICIRTLDGKRLISSKGLLGRMFTIDEDGDNAYWKAANDTKIFDHLDQHYPGVHVQAFGEVLPCQKGFSYGLTNTTARFFRIDVNATTIGIADLPNDIYANWVPLIYRGPFNPNEVRALREGKETLSGKELHIREGVVCSPVQPRKSHKGCFDLFCKIINPAYKETGEEFN